MYKNIIKEKLEIKKIKKAGKIASNVLKMISEYIVPNITTGELDRICHDYIIHEEKAFPACLGYNGFPKSTCISINDVVCHGIPNDKQKLKNGDIVNIDVTIMKNSYHADTSKMFLVGKPTILGKRLCYVAKKSLDLAIKIIKPNISINEIGKVIQNYVEKKDFSIVQEYCGHGIGQKFHEDPQILHYYNENNKFLLKENMTFTIEPMINAGSHEIKLMRDGWTVKTKDRSLSAQYEHTILVTKKGSEILTL
ncbi:type I methionyl aminopeptidase [Buchnera aphidicola (Mindarus keteleerifoliae)]|uniref:type I methionyl aminopeptidase n=1 Tax=Buchnera aphidicola TaxID=9 RepID=UPI0031B72637